MAHTVPTAVPASLRAGDTATWLRSLADYPASDGWVLSYVLVKTGAQIAITATASGADHLVEVDAATNNGIDVMRDIMSPLRYHGFGDTPNKAVILDEAHMLTKQAWASLLKIVEEPPPHVFFMFCTTDAGKVPDNIATRCLRYSLRLLRHDDLMDLL